MACSCCCEELGGCFVPLDPEGGQATDVAAPDAPCNGVNAEAKAELRRALLPLPPAGVDSMSACVLAYLRYAERPWAVKAAYAASPSIAASTNTVYWGSRDIKSDGDAKGITYKHTVPPPPDDPELEQAFSYYTYMKGTNGEPLWNKTGIVQSGDSAVRPMFVSNLAVTPGVYGKDGSRWYILNGGIGVNASNVPQFLMTRVERGSQYANLTWEDGTDTSKTRVYTSNNTGGSTNVSNWRLKSIVDDAGARYDLTYDGSSTRITSLVCSSGATNVRKMDATYSGSKFASLKSYDWSGGAWALTSESYYRYPASGCTDQPTYAVADAGALRMRADGLDPATATDGQFASYADSTYEYDGACKVTKVTRGSGEMTRFAADASTYTAGTDPNKWVRSRTDNARPDLGGGTDGPGQTIAYYFNGDDQVVLKTVKTYLSGGTSPVKTEHTFYVYGTYNFANKLTHEYTPESVSSVTVNSDGTLTVSKEANTGLVRVSEYHDSTNDSSGGLSAVYSDSDGTSHVQVDPAIDFNWGTNPPADNTAANNFTVVWLGQTIPQYSQTYTFYVTATGTGASATLYIDDMIVVSASNTTASATKAMTAGQRYKLRVRHTGGTAGSKTAKLEWQSSSQSRQVIPSGRLYPGLALFGYLKGRSVKQGDSGTAIPLEAYEYLSAATPDTLLSKVTRYPNDANTSDGEETTYAYPLGFGATGIYRPVSTTTTVKLSGTQSLVSKRYSHADGRVQFELDPDGSVSFYEYYTSGNGNNQLRHHVRDINTSSPPSGVTLPGSIPSGFSTSGGQNLLTKYTYDADRNVQAVTDPSGLISWTLNLDHASYGFGGKTYDRFRESRVYPLSFDGANYSVAGPVRITFGTKDGQSLSTQTAKVTLASASAGPASGDTVNSTLSRTDPVLSTAGQATGSRVYHKYASGTVDTSGGSAAYLETLYYYDALGRPNKVTDPAGKSTFTTYGVVDASGSGSGPYYLETRSYPAVTSLGGGSYALAGPIAVSWSDTRGRSVRSFLATATVTSATPSGTETLTELSRTTTKYDWRNRADTVWSYFNLASLSFTQDGTKDTNYYETKYAAYDNQGRVLRVKDGIGDISATVYDAAGRAVSSWRGTDATSATRTDPTGGGAGGNDMKKVGETFYDSARDGTGTMKTYATRSTRLKAIATLAGTSADYTGVNFDYDTAGRRTWSKPDSGGGTWNKQDYDAGGRVTASYAYSNGSTTDLLAYSTSTFDGAGRLTTAKQFEVVSGASTGNALVSTTAYDDAGRVSKATAPGAGGFTKTEYDAAGRVTRSFFCSDEGASSALSNDVVLTQTDLAYDAAGNAIQTTSYARNHDASGGTTGALSDSASSARVTYQASYYDDGHRLTYSADYGTNGGSAFTRPGTAPEPNASDNILVTKLAYDTAGRQKDQTDNKGTVTRREYDHLGRLTKLTENYVDGTPGGSGGDAEDRVTSYTYNANGQVVTQTADLPAGQTDQVTTYIYSASLTDKGCPVKSNAYLRAVVYPDSDDGVVSNALSNGTDSTYDRVEMTYHADGSLATKKDQRGVVMTYAYDLAGRLTEQKVTAGTVPGDQQIKTGYTSLGQVEKVTSYSIVDIAVTNEVQRAYNGLGQATTEYQEHAGVVVTLTSPKAQYAYDTAASGGAFTKGLRLKYVTYPNGREVFRVYDGHGGIDDATSRPNKISDGSAGTPGTALSTYSYMGNGAIVREDYTTPQVRLDLWGGTTGTYPGLDRFGRVVDQQWRNYNASVDRDRFKYGYDRASNRTYREDSLAATLHDHLYSYDALHRLTDSQRGTLNGTKDAISTLAFAQQWALSPVGNWSTFKQDDNGDTSWELNQSRTHNAVNEITAIGTWIAPAYDAAGSMTSGPKPGAETTRHHYAYDAWNRLISVKADSSGSPGSTIATYSYDGLNRRVQKVIASPSDTFDYYYNTSWQLLEERKGGSAYSQYVWSLRYIDAPIARSRDADGNSGNGLEEVLFYLGDANMSVTALVNTGGAVVERVTYDAYGKPMFREADWDLQVVSGHTDGTASLYDNPVLYCGYRYDPEAGAYQVRFRMYHPSLGRWMQRDPAGYINSASLYEYVRSAPALFQDSSGKIINKFQVYRDIESMKFDFWVYILEYWASRDSKGQVALEDYRRKGKGAGKPSCCNIINKLDWHQVGLYIYHRLEWQNKPDGTPKGWDEQNNKFFWTTRGGWVDLEHVIRTGLEAERFPDTIVESVARGIERDQARIGHRSGYSVEDLPSNRFGVEFAHFFSHRDICDLPNGLAKFINTRLGGLGAPPIELLESDNQGFNWIRNFSSRPVLDIHGGQVHMDSATGIRYVSSGNRRRDRDLLDLLSEHGFSATSNGGGPQMTHYGDSQHVR